MNKVMPLLLAAGILFAACTSSPGTTASSSPSPSSATEASASPVPNEGNVKVFTVKGLNFAFDIKEIKVKQGDRVQITLANTEGFHDWRVDEFNAYTKQVGPGMEDTASFVADKTGTFEYYCSVGQHRSLGMVGKLVVE